MIDSKDVTPISSEVGKAGLTNLTVSIDDSTKVVYLATGEDAVVGKGIKLSADKPSHTFFGHRNTSVNAITPNAVAVCIHAD